MDGLAISHRSRVRPDNEQLTTNNYTRSSACTLFGNDATTKA